MEAFALFKTREALIPYLLLLAAVVAGILWHLSGALPGLGRTTVGGRIDIGGPYRLINQDGKSVSSADFHGRYQLIYFGYSYCPDVCPTTLGVIAEALRKLGSDQDRIVPIFITIDPARDTPHILKQYMAAFGPRFVGLTGSASQISAAEKEFHVYAKKVAIKGGGYGLNHSSVIYLMGPKDQLVTFYDELISPSALAKDLRSKI